VEALRPMTDLCTGKINVIHVYKIFISSFIPYKIIHYLYIFIQQIKYTNIHLQYIQEKNLIAVACIMQA